MIYVTAIEEAADLADWLRSESMTASHHAWAGSTAVQLALTGLDPADTLADALEPLRRMPQRRPGMPMALGLHFGSPVAGGAEYQAIVDDAQFAGALAALNLIETQYTQSIDRRCPKQARSLLGSVARNCGEGIVTVTIACWFRNACGAWNWLDPWTMIGEMPEVRIAYVRGIEAELARRGLALSWHGPETARIGKATSLRADG